MRKLLTLAIPIVLGVGLLTALVSNPNDGKQASRRQGGVAAENALPAVIEESPPATAAATPATQPAPAVPETTTTTVAPAPSTTSTTARATTTTMAKPKPAPTTTTTMMVAASDAPPSTIDCGTGSASARAMMVAGSSAGTYQLTAKVTNESNRDIELDSLVVHADYPSGGKDYVVKVTGKQIAAAPGVTEAMFSIPESQGPQPTNFAISEFRFHTAGIPECASH